jgi:hypothetical protein
VCACSHCCRVDHGLDAIVIDSALSSVLSQSRHSHWLRLVCLDACWRACFARLPCSSCSTRTTDEFVEIASRVTRDSPQHTINKGDRSVGGAVRIGCQQQSKSGSDHLGSNCLSSVSIDQEYERIDVVNLLTLPDYNGNTKEQQSADIQKQGRSKLTRNSG